MEPQNNPPHFKGRDALSHVVAAQRDGIISSSEVHGQEPSGQWIAFIDAFREALVILLLVLTPLFFINTPFDLHLKIVFFVACGFAVWKTGRSALLGWSRLERLHRIVEQEKWEIEHHRQQEREELTELYRAKGFSGKLLEDVIDVLMSDGDRLLRVMIEEELGLTLGNQEHPLKQALGAFLGVFLAAALFLASLLISPFWGPLVLSAFLLSLAGYLAAWASDNLKIPSIVWHFSLGLLSFGFTYFLFSEFP